MNSFAHSSEGLPRVPLPWESFRVPYNKRRSFCFVKCVRNGLLVKSFDTLTVYQELGEGQVVHQVARVTRLNESAIRIQLGKRFKTGFPLSRRGFVRLGDNMLAAALIQALSMSAIVENSHDDGARNCTDGSRDGGNNRGFHKHLSKSSDLKVRP